MITFTDGYANRNSSGVQDTIYVLHIKGDIDTYYSTQAVKGQATTAIILDRPSLAPTSLNLLSGSSSVGSVSMRLLDLAGVVTELRQSYSIRGTQAELWIGYKGLPFAEYLSALNGRISRFSRDADGLSYSLEVSDKIERLDLDVFKPSDIASEPYSTATKSYDSGSLILSDTDSDSVYDTVTLYGNPVDIMLKLLLSGGDAVSSDYNVWPVWAGCALLEADVDVAWCEAERDKILTVEMQFTITDTENAKQFIETEICKALGGWLLLSGTGKIRLRYPSSATLAEVTTDTLSDGVLVSKPQWSDSDDLLVTHVDFEIDHDGSGFQLVLPRRASPEWLAGNVTDERVHKISSRGLQSTLGGISIADAVADAIFQRYGTPPARVRCQTFFERHSIEAGDIVEMTSDFYPNIDARGVGATRLIEVLSVKPSANRVDIDGIDLTTPLTQGTSAVISPTGTADFTAATAAQKERYAWLADDATGQLSDGRAAYVWA